MKKKRNYTKCLAKRNKHPTQSLNEFFCGIIPKLSFLQETQKLETQKFGFGLNGDVLSAKSSLLSQNSLLTGKITGKMNANSFHLALKVQYLLSKADFSCKFNREFN